MNKTLILSVLVLSACASVTSYEPIVDFKGVDRNHYAADLGECQQYAAQVENNAVMGAVVLGLVGAGVGAAIGDSFDRTGDMAAYGATMGAVSGGVGGTADHNYKTQNVIQTCLQGRGYKVLGSK